MGFVKRVVPSFVKEKIKKAIDRRAVERLYASWQVAANKISKAGTTGEQTKSVRRVLIVPTDPWTLIGAVGDDAMISSTVGVVRAQNADAEIHIITGDENANVVARNIGLVPVEIWNAKNYCDRAFQEISEKKYDAVVVLGADVLDGYYGATIAAKLLLTADLAARMGARVTVLGFSFNSKPVPILRPFFEELSGSVKLHVRESTSEERFRAFSRHPVRLVADSAFMLKPQSASDELLALRNWVKSRREKGRLILGMNVHPMLIKGASEEQIQEIIRCTARAIENISENHPVSWVLIPHDYRESLGDDTCLLPVLKQLQRVGNVDVYYIKGKHRAATLKAMAGEVDGVIAGRMHLVIASLGMGTPVFALKYQDKFEGLLNLFGLPQEMAITAEELIDDSCFKSRLNAFVGALADMRAAIEQALPSMLEASNANFYVILKNST